MTFLIIIGSILALVLIYLAAIVFLPWIKVRKKDLPTNNRKEVAKPSCRKDVTFEVNGIRVHGWLYLPANIVEPVACVVFAQGFCGTKDMLLQNYALRFVEAGFAALSIDYRHFGESAGEPRQLYSIKKQLEDLRATIQYARSRNEVDDAKVFIWGTSSSGNYGIMLAAEDPNIAGIIGQCPSFDHQADGKRILKRDGMAWFLKLIVHAQRDKGRSRLGLSAHTFPVAGPSGTTAMFISPDALQGYSKIAKESETFINEVCARLMFDPHGPDLLKSAEKVKCPALFHICENDTIVAPDTHHKITALLGDKAEVIKNPIGHFDIYFGDYYEKSIGEQIAFLKRCLK